MTFFSKVKLYLTLVEVGELVTRKELVKTLTKDKYTYTLDSYRLWFTNAGYLEHVGRGVYKKVKEIPDLLSSRDLRKEAYPHYMEWSEYKHPEWYRRK